MTRIHQVTGIRLVAAAAGGGLMYLAFPPIGWWWCAPVSLGILYAAVTVGRPRAALGTWCGFVFGLGFFLPLLPWVGVYVGPVPWLALAAIMALYLALFGLAATVTGRLATARPAAGPLWFALCWTAVEYLRSSFPFGGFPWGRAAFSQPGGPLLRLASLLGAPGLSFALALLGASLAAVVIAAVPLVTRRSRRWHGAVAAAWGTAAVVVATVLAALAGTAGLHTVGTVEVAGIQGNVPRLGLDFNEQRAKVLENHVDQTVVTAREITAGDRAQPDLVLWPENASDIPPDAGSYAAGLITGAARAIDAPILVGTLLAAGPGPTNTVLVWDPRTGEPIGRYDKHILQPFGETLPWRPFFSLFSQYADRAGNFQPGSGPSVLTVPTRAGEVVVGVTTCWEVAFDRAPRAAIREGAQLLYVPTNNATFGHTDMTYQQLAMSQLRAAETGRAVAVVATSGVSALIAPNGDIIAESAFFTPETLQAGLPLVAGQTLAVRLGAWPELLAVLAALAGFLYAASQQTRFKTLRRRQTSEIGSRTSAPERRSTDGEQ